MENFNNLTLESAGVPGGAIVDTVASAVKNFAGNIKDKAKLKSGLELLQQGNLGAISGKQVELMVASGMASAQLLNIPAWQVLNSQGKFGTPEVITASGIRTDGINSPLPFDLKQYIPWILGAIVIGALIYFITKK